MLIIYGSCSHLRSAHNSVRKYVGIPSFLTIASAAYKNCFLYAGAPLTELTNESALYLANNLSIFPLKLLLAIFAVSVLDLILCIVKFIDKSKGVAHIQTRQKIYNLHLMQSTDESSTTFD